MYRLLSAILHFLMVAMRPPPGTGAGAVRKAGAVTVAFGLSVLLLAAVLVGILQKKLGDQALAVQLATPLWFTGLGSLVVGAFRLILASEPDQTSPTKRMALGVLFGCGTLVLLVVLVLLFALVADWLATHSP